MDSIPLKLPNGTTLELERPSKTNNKKDHQPLSKKAKLDIKSSMAMPQLRTIPPKPSSATAPAVGAATKLITQPRTIPGLKKDEFLIPTMNNATGQQQFLVVKRLDQSASGSTNVVRPNAPPLLKTVPSISPSTNASPTMPLQIKTIPTPPPPASTSPIVHDLNMPQLTNNKASAAPQTPQNIKNEPIDSGDTSKFA